MACIIPSSVVTDLTQVYSGKINFNGKDHDESGISKDIQKFNDEQVTHSEEHEENIEKNVRESVCSVFMSSNEESCCNQEKLESNEASIIINKIHPNDGINLNKSNKENELRIDYNKSCDNNSNTVKKILKSNLSLADNDSTEEINLDETLNKNSITDDEYGSGSPEYLQAVEHTNNLKNKNLRRIIDSESEDDVTSESNNFPQTIHNTISTASSHIIYKHYHYYVEIFK